MNDIRWVLCSLAALCLSSCENQVRDESLCNAISPCAAGFVCTPDFRCVPAGDGAAPDTAGDAMAADTGGVDAGDDASGSCIGDMQCTGELRPLCRLGACVGCQEGSADACSNKSAAKPYCDATSGACVACLQDTDCPDTAPACVAGACVLCNAAGANANACSSRKAEAPVCGGQGLCVECVGNLDCQSASKPICANNACRGCQADTECTAAPGVCLNHLDGRCASLAETVFVENVAGKCTNAANAGTQAAPFCGLAQAIGAAGTKPLVVLVGPEGVDRASFAGPGTLALVGKEGALIAPGAGRGLDVTGGQLVARGLTIKGGTRQGIVVSGGASLDLANSKVLDNTGGGILVDGGKLVLRDTVVAGNGPGDDGGAIWGGIRVKAPAPGTRLDRVSVLDNKAPGVSCSTGLTGTGVYAFQNSSLDIAPTCNLTSCTPLSPTCGAPP